MTTRRAITQAVIPARGLGSRMRRTPTMGAALDGEQSKAADNGAKAMMPLGGRPFLDYVLSALADAGIAEATLVIGPDHEEIRRHYSDSSRRRVRISFAIQEKPLGVADAVLAARDAVREAPFLMLNSDNYYPVEAIRALAATGEAGLIAFEADTLVRESGIEPERVLNYAFLDVDGDGWLRDIREKPDTNDPLVRRAERWVSMNLWSFTPKIFEACGRVRTSVRGELELMDAVMIAMRELGEGFRAIPMRAGILDLSSRGDVAFVASRLAGIDPSP